MKHNLKSILSLLIFLIVLTLCTGCNGNNAIIPAVDPNPPVNPENSTVSYVEVTASPSNRKVNKEIQLVVKGYNSDAQWVILDKSKIKAWKWTVQGQCYNCIASDVDLSPKSNSLTATFASKVTGTFFIAAYYQENIADDYIADYI